MITLTVKIIFSFISAYLFITLMMKILMDLNCNIKDILIQFLIGFILILFFSSIILYLIDFYKLDANIAKLFEITVNKIDKDIDNTNTKPITISVMIWLFMMFSFKSYKQ